MPKAKIYPQSYKVEVHKQHQNNTNNSLTKINASYLHQNYTTLHLKLGLCRVCNSSGSDLMYPCYCQQQAYHPHCLKYYLKDRMRKQEDIIESKDDFRFILCKSCGHKIKWKTASKFRCKNCSDACETVTQKKCQTATFIILILIAVACLAYLLVVACNVPGMEMLGGISKSALTIALCVIVGLLLVIILYCFVDCLTENELKVDTLYDKREKSQRARSNMSDRSGNEKRSRSGRDTIIVQEME